jgi:hypothetical protein
MTNHQTIKVFRFGCRLGIEMCCFVQAVMDQGRSYIQGVTYYYRNPPLESMYPPNHVVYQDQLNQSTAGGGAAKKKE